MLFERKAADLCDTVKWRFPSCGDLTKQTQHPATCQPPNPNPTYFMAGALVSLPLYALLAGICVHGANTLLLCSSVTLSSGKCLHS